MIELFPEQLFVLNKQEGKTQQYINEFIKLRITLDELIEKFKKITTQTNATESLIARLIAASTANFQDEIKWLKNQISILMGINHVTEYKIQTIELQL